MTLATDLQNLIADVSAAIAANKPMGRADLEIMRRNLSAIADDARRHDTAQTVAGLVLRDLFDGIENKAADLSRLAAHQRHRLTGDVARMVEGHA
ncbi:hypothetical protein I6G65_16000 [Sphingomonas paucimobilis]|uniref:DNA, contig: SP630 n=1 Tax=Sphingomonas paucimobilis NBRC 13935 TaxID=1219050 RepID=A0A0C9MTV5_SPHPI|nr:hypothetical protein [Sphingomonas paucimobilis]QPS15793.1 hypothetical protein I6G65_16000 [Sphingomonas paucimobilis]GAN14136.1 hypothetical protein SP6_30_02770 [Sphingomonas paucimobilis NBRC 13935]SUJ08231.1 Uncharacterised protein [Sphingomonas paucimobilis]